MTTSSASGPDPLTPYDCDLVGLPYMPLEVQRFRDSDFLSRETPEIVVAAITLWCAAWHQVPASSLPDDDVALARLAGYGRSLAVWRRMRSKALYGFIKCSDGRLYHPVIARWANESWETRRKTRHEKFQATIRQHNKRDKDENESRDQLQAPSFQEWEASGRPRRIAEWREVSRVIGGDRHE